jgi:hypothetical protein
MLCRGGRNDCVRERSICAGRGTHASVIFNGLLRHVVFAEVGEEVIADDGIDRLEAFAGSCLLVLGGDSRGDSREGSNDWGGGSSDGGHG